MFFSFLGSCAWVDYFCSNISIMYWFAKKLLLWSTILHFPVESQSGLISQSFPATAGGGGGGDRLFLSNAASLSSNAPFEPTSSIANWSRPKLLRAPLQMEREDVWNFSISSAADAKRDEIRVGGIISAKRRANKVGRRKIFINKSAPTRRLWCRRDSTRERELFFPLSPDVFVRAKPKLQKLQGKREKMRNSTACSNPDKFPLVIFIRRAEKLYKLLLLCFKLWFSSR